MLINKDKIHCITKNDNCIEVIFDTINWRIMRNTIKLIFYTNFYAICPICGSDFKTEVARGVVGKIKRNECGVCEDCEIKNFLEQN